MIIVTTGGRDEDVKYDTNVSKFVGEYARPGNILVVGGASGWDEMMRRLWHYEFQLPYVVHPAPWNSTGRAAGPMRNTDMIRGTSLAPHAHLPPDVVLAGPGGRGTANCVRQAKGRGNIEIVYYAQD